VLAVKLNAIEVPSKLQVAHDLMTKELQRYLDGWRSFRYDPLPPFPGTVSTVNPAAVNALAEAEALRAAAYGELAC
jgi:hypothetical protein